MPFDIVKSRSHLVGLLRALRRLSATLGSVVEVRVARAIALYRLELRRTASVLALSLAAALLGCASVVFVALAVMIAFWPTHPVVASVMIAVAFAALAVVAATLVRGRTGATEPPPSPRSS